MVSTYNEAAILLFSLFMIVWEIMIAASSLMVTAGKKEGTHEPSEM